MLRVQIFVFLKLSSFSSAVVDTVICLPSGVDLSAKPTIELNCDDTFAAKPVNPLEKQETWLPYATENWRGDIREEDPPMKIN